jgi:hypothetical protein
LDAVALDEEVAGSLDEALETLDEATEVSSKSGQDGGRGDVAGVLENEPEMSDAEDGAKDEVENLDEGAWVLTVNPEVMTLDAIGCLAGLVVRSSSLSESLI